MGAYAELGLLSVVPRLGAFEAILGFLVISGYSVTSSYAAKPAGFLARRLKRLFPVYAVSLIATLLVTVYVEKASWPNPLVIAANALFLNQMVTATSIVGPAWSLSLEFWLYCLLPLLYPIDPKTSRWLVWTSFVAYLAYTALRTL